jgi:hypothetical protein
VSRHLWLIAAGVVGSAAFGVLVGLVVVFVAHAGIDWTGIAL